jgi:hypothetical protein
MKLIGVRFLGRTLLFSRSFLYVLILINLFIDVKKFANFLNNFLKRRSEMNEEDLKELLEFLTTDYGRGYLAGVVSVLSMLSKISKKVE